MLQTFLPPERYGLNYKGESMIESKHETVSILLVEEEEWVRDSLIEFFSGNGYEVYAVGTAEQGLEEFMANRYDAVIVDEVLPGMNGLRFLRMMDAEGPEHPVVVFLSGRTSGEIMESARRLGADVCLGKPFSAQQLEERIKDFLD